MVASAGTESENDLELFASWLTVIVCVPETAAAPMVVSATAELFDVAPALEENTPSKLVSDANAEDSADTSVPRPDSTVSCACSAAVCAAQAVSGVRWTAMMLATVLGTSKPVPLAADPKLMPTDILN